MTLLVSFCHKKVHSYPRPHVRAPLTKTGAKQCPYFTFDRLLIGSDAEVNKFNQRSGYESLFSPLAAFKQRVGKTT